MCILLWKVHKIPIIWTRLLLFVYELLACWKISSLSKNLDLFLLCAGRLCLMATSLRRHNIRIPVFPYHIVQLMLPFLLRCFCCSRSSCAYLFTSHYLFAVAVVVFAVYLLFWFLIDSSAFLYLSKSILYLFSVFQHQM